MNCQAQFKGCYDARTDNPQFGAWHHWPKKSTAFYKKRPHLLYSYKHRVWVCQSCHNILDVEDQSRNKEVFCAATMEVARLWKMGAEVDCFLKVCKDSGILPRGK